MNSNSLLSLTLSSLIYIILEDNLFSKERNEYIDINLGPLSRIYGLDNR